MKKVIACTLQLLGYFSSFVYPYKLALGFRWCKEMFYTGWMKRRFSVMKGRLLGKIKVNDGDCIIINERTRIFERVELQIIKNASGKETNPNISVGRNCLIQRDCQITSSNSVRIEDNVHIAARTLITDTVHGDFSTMSFTFDNGSDIPDVFLQNAETRPYVSKGPVIIEHDVHIGMNCVIMPAVTIGHNSVIAAGTIVNRNVPPYSLVSGNPCQVVSFG